MEIDERAYNDAPLDAPSPLPFVSRKALRRVKAPVRPPVKCRYCDGDVHLVDNREIYGRPYGEWHFAYLCEDCRAYVGLHPGTDLPLGTLANEKLREARTSNKRRFAKMTDRLEISRGHAYSWLAKKMNIPKAECHWALFDIEDCDLAGQFCQIATNKGKLT